MIEHFLTFFRASAMFVVGMWVIGYFTSKLSRDVVQLPTLLALLCGYPRKGGYVNFQAACFQLSAVLIPLIGTVVLSLYGIGKPTLLISLVLILGMPILTSFLLRVVVQQNGR